MDKTNCAEPCLMVKNAKIGFKITKKALHVVSDQLRIYHIITIYKLHTLCFVREFYFFENASIRQLISLSNSLSIFSSIIPIG